jgi:hypothetical protein
MAPNEFASGICAHLDKRVDAMSKSMDKRFDHIDTVLQKHGEALVKLTTERKADKEHIDELRAEVARIERESAKREFSRGKTAGALAALTSGAAAVGAIVAKALHHN